MIKIGPGVATYRPDVILKRNGRNAIIFEFKKPRENLNNHIYQLVSYCQNTKTPFGVLFNGKQLHIFANTKLPQLRWLTKVEHPIVRHKGYSSAKTASKPISFDDVPILSVKGSPRELASALLLTSKLSLEGKGISIVESIVAKIARDRAKIAVMELRHNDIRNHLNQIKADPSPEILEAIAKAHPHLSSLKPMPTTDELKQSWLPKPILKNAADKAWETRRAKEQLIEAESEKQKK